MDYLKKLGKGVITFIAIIFAVMIIIAVVQVAKGDYEENEKPVEKQEKVVEPEETEVEDTSDTVGETFIEAYVDGCSESGMTSVSECQCQIDYLDENLTNEKLLNDAVSVSEGGDLTPAMWEAVEFCLSEV